MKEKNKNVASEAFAMGLKYYGGIGCERDFARAAEYFLAAKRAGEKNSLYYLGLCALEKKPKDMESAQKFLRLAAKSGDGGASRRLGLLFLNDMPFPLYGKAARAFWRGCKQGDAGCFYYYGVCLQNGMGVKRDASAAFETFCRGAEKGDVDCLAEKGRALLTGVGTERNLDAAGRLLEKAAGGGSLTALALMGVCDEETQKEVGFAVRKYFAAAEGGNAEGLFRLAKAFYDGKGVKRDVGKAAAFAQRAAEQKHSQAMELYGRMCFRGEGVPLAYEKARLCFLSAYERGAQAARAMAKRAARYRKRNKAGYAAYYAEPLRFEREGFFIEDDVLLRYTGKPVCVLPDGIRAIAAGAFSGELKKVTFPASLSRIAAGAFTDATVREFAAARDCLCVKIRDGRAYDKKGNPI